MGYPGPVPPDIRTLIVGAGFIGSDYVGTVPSTRSLAPLYIGDGHAGEECVGTAPDPQSFAGPGLVIGSSISFVGEGRIGATDQQWAPAQIRRVQVDKSALWSHLSIHDSLTCFYPLDEGGAVDLRDLSFNRKHVLGPPTGLQWLWGPRGKTFYGTGTSFPTLPVIPTATKGSIGFWVNPVSPSGTENDQIIYSHEVDASNYLAIGIDAVGAVFIQVKSAGSGVSNRISGGALTFNTWNYILWESSAVKYFLEINGQSITSLTIELGVNDGSWFNVLSSGISYITNQDIPATAATLGVAELLIMEKRQLTADEKILFFRYPDSVYRQIPPIRGLMGPFPTPTAGTVRSTEQEGTDAIFLKVIPAGVPTAEKEGTDPVFLKVAPSGVPTAEKEGTDVVKLKLTLTGVPTAETEGTDVVKLKLTLIGVPTAEREGTDASFLKLSPAGVPTAQALGTDTVRLKLTFTGVPTAEQEGTDPVLLRLSTAGVPTAQILGTDPVRLALSLAGTPTAQNLGREAVSLRISLAGVGTAEATGTLIVSIITPPTTGQPLLNITVELAATDLAAVLGSSNLMAILGGTAVEARMAATDLALLLARAGIEVSIDPQNLDVNL